MNEGFPLAEVIIKTTALIIQTDIPKVNHFVQKSVLKYHQEGRKKHPTRFNTYFNIRTGVNGKVDNSVNYISQWHMLKDLFSVLKITKTDQNSVSTSYS